MTRILIAGNWNNPVTMEIIFQNRHWVPSAKSANYIFFRAHGFTLIEITIVMALIGVLLFFAIPRFQDALFIDPSKKPSRWLMVTIPQLRSSAIRHQRYYHLHVDLTDNRLWTTHAAQTDEAQDRAKKKGYRLSEEVRLTGVVFANGKKQTVDVVSIGFHPQAWADRAIIHMETDSRDRYSFIIHPFLSRLERIEGYQDFDAS